MIGIGGYIVGSSAGVEGRVRNLNIYQTGYDNITCVYDHENFVEGEHHVLFYVNGKLVAIANDGVATLSGLSDGYQNINAIPQLISDPISEIYYDENDGRRVLLTWQSSGDEIIGYNIYAVDIDGNNPVKIDQVETKISNALNQALPAVGTGSGKISATATQLPNDSFGNVVIKILANGQGSYKYNNDPAVPFDFTKGTLIYVTHNIPVLFCNEIEDYVNGDEWTINTGVLCNWLSQDLSHGNYRYAISSYDRFANESNLILSDVFEVLQQADPVTDEIVIYDELAKTLSIDYVLPANADHVRLYTNYLPTEGYLDRYVQIGPTAIGYGSDLNEHNQPIIGTGFLLHFGTNGYGYGYDNSYTYGYGYQDLDSMDFFDVFDVPNHIVEGDFKYYLMPVTAAGIELQDFSLREMSVPPSAVDKGYYLGSPETLVAMAAGGNKWQVEWSYYFDSNDTLSHFTIHRVVDDNDLTLDVNDQIGNVSAIQLADGLTEQYNFSFDDPLGSNTYKIAIISHNTYGDKMISDTVTVTTVGTITLNDVSGLIGGTV